MGAIIDIIIVAIAAYTIIMSAKRGFVKAVIGGLGFFLAVIVAIALCAPVADTLKEGGFGTSVSNAVDRVVEKKITAENYESAFDKDDEKGSLYNICKTFGAEDRYDDMKENYDEWRDAGVVSAQSYIKESIREPAVNLCCTVLAFILLFLASWALLKILEVVLGKIVDLPVLKHADKALGVVIGLPIAVLRVFVACLIIKWALPVAGSFGWEWALNTDLSDSFLYSAIEGINFLSGII